MIALLNLIEVEYAKVLYLLLSIGNLGFNIFTLYVPYPFRKPGVGFFGLFELLGFLLRAILIILVASGWSLYLSSHCF